MIVLFRLFFIAKIVKCVDLMECKESILANYLTSIIKDSFLEVFIRF